MVVIWFVYLFMTDDFAKDLTTFEVHISDFGRGMVVPAVLKSKLAI